MTADQILNHTLLYVGGTLFRICEIEFYIYSSSHPDPYVHRNYDQRQYGSWYFHPKGGTFKGLDFVISSGDLYCSVLIRSIMDGDGNMTEGPCNVVNKILTIYSVQSVFELTGGNTHSWIPQSDPRGLYLMSASIPIQPIWTGRRIGLSDKYPEYQYLSYRYLTYPDKIRKQKTGLVQYTV